MNNIESIIKQQLSNYIVIFKPLLLAFGPAGAFYLNELISYQDFLESNNLLEEDQFFTFSPKRVETNTGLDKFQQNGILKKLRDIEVISTELRYQVIGEDNKTTPKNFFKIDFEKVYQIISSVLENKQSTSIFKEEISNFNSIFAEKEKNIYNNNIYNNISSRSYIESSDESSTVASTRFSLVNKTDEGVNNFGLKIPITMKKRKKDLPNFEKPISTKYRKDTLDIISYWNNSPGLPKHTFPLNGKGEWTNPTKVFKDIILIINQLLDGVFFLNKGMPEVNRIYTKEEIITVIDKYKLIATNPGYYPLRKDFCKTTKLNDFFYNPWASYNPSYFLKYLVEEPKIVQIAFKKAIEKNSYLTKGLKSYYTTKILNLTITEKTFSDIDENKFVIGSNLLTDTISRFQKRLNLLTRPIEWCEIVIDALIDNWSSKEVKVGHVASEYTYNEILPRYLKKKGRID